MAQTAPDLVAEAKAALLEGRFDDAAAAADAAVATEDSGQVRYFRGDLNFLDDRLDEARDDWQSAFRLLRAEGQLALAARAACGVAELDAHFGRMAAAQGWVERARTVLDELGPCVEWGHLELAVMACDRVDMIDLLESAERALAIALEFDDADLEARAMADSGLALVTGGRVREGLARLDAALAAISAGEVSYAAASICFCSLLASCDRAGDVRRAEEWTAIISEATAPLDGRPVALRTHCRLAYGSVLQASGRWDEAERLLVDALGPADQPSAGHRPTTTAYLAALRVEQGRAEEAAALLAPFEDLPASCGPLARVHLAQGELDLGAAVLRRGLDELAGDALREAPLLACLVEIEVARGDLDQAAAAAAQLAALAESTPLVSLRAEAARAEGRVLAAAGDLEGAADALNRAKVLLANDEQPFLRGCVRLELAEVRAAAGDSPAAITEGRAALACFERLGAARSRDRASALLRDLGDTGRLRPQRADQLTDLLTKRENEVLQLVAEGLTNAQIAERLFISPKTAEHHVGRVLTKLGVRSRAEAAALAVRLATSP